MKPRTVMLTLELRDCDISLSKLRHTKYVELWLASALETADDSWRDASVAQATATVAQPSTPAVRVRVQKAPKRKGKRVKG